MPSSYIAFDRKRQIAAGELRQVALSCKAILDQDDHAQILVFNALTGEVVDLDFRNLEPEQEPASRGPGRPKLGVVAREVTLLPRHWEWLASQPGGASVALRKLVEQRGLPGAAKTAGGRRRMPAITSCRPWPAICRSSRKHRARCLRMIGGVSPD